MIKLASIALLLMFTPVNPILEGWRDGDGKGYCFALTSRAWKTSCPANARCYTALICRRDETR